MKLLIIGNLKGHAGQATRIALNKGAKVEHSDNIKDSLKILRSGNSIELVLIDIELNISNFIKSVKQEQITIPIVACGVETDAKKAASAIKAGAKEYLPMPPNEELIGAVLQIIAEDSQQMIFKDKNMKKIVDLAKKVSPSDASILITGKSGTGKEIMAKFIHKNSKRHNNNFVAVNCAAIPENLLESELFGHEKGAFTGAIARRIGKFEEANNGTILLDEISEMDIKLQSKLLRVLQEREIVRLGGNTQKKINVRVLATSNRNMQEEIKLGRFREDLYFRLNVINIEIPQLNERPQDIEVLANYFVEKFSQQNGHSIKKIEEKTLKALKNHTWKGNIRELENTMHRAVLLSNDTIDLDSVMLPKAEDNNNSKSSVVGKTMAEMERILIIDTLKHTLGNKSQAANILGISIKTLRNKLKIFENE